VPESTSKNFVYLWGTRQESAIAQNNRGDSAKVYVPKNMVNYFESYIKKSYETYSSVNIQEDVANVNGISYSYLMTYGSKETWGGLNTESIIGDNPLNIAKFQPGNPPQKSIIYYLPEYKNYVEKTFVPLLNKLNGRILNTSLIMVHQKASLYQYDLRQAPAALEGLMRNGKSIIVDDLDYALYQIQISKFTFNNSYYALSPTNKSYTNFPLIKSIKKWPSGTQTPDKNPSNHWAQITVATKQGDKIYPLKLSITTVSPFNIMFILGTSTALEREEINQVIAGLPPFSVPKWVPLFGNDTDFVGGYLSADVLQERKWIDEILKYIPINKNIPGKVTVPSAPSITVPKPVVIPTTTTTIPKTTTTTLTPPKSTTTSTIPKPGTTVVKPKVIPDRLDPLPPSTITPPNTTVITNKEPIIIGDSIAKGLSDRYDSLNNTETSQIVPNVLEGNPSACENATYFPGNLRSIFCQWDGFYQKVGLNVTSVQRLVSNTLRYIDQKDKKLTNRIVWLSTGAANEIAYMPIQDILSKIKVQFDSIKVYTDRKKIAMVFVVGISNQQNQKYKKGALDFNSQLKALCQKYNYIFIGGFDSPGDGVHPSGYDDLVDDLIGRIPDKPIVIPPTTVVPPTTVPITTAPTTPTTIAPTTTVTKWIPAAPGARPGSGAAGIGAPKPVTTTSTTSTTAPAQQSTTTTTVASNGSITTTTITFPPKIPVLPPYTPGTTTTTSPEGIVTTTTTAANGVVTTTTVTPSTVTTVPGPTTTVTTSVPVTTTVPTRPDPTIPDRIDPPLPSAPEPKLVSYLVESLTPENDTQRVNIDVSVTLEFDIPVKRGTGTIFFYKKNTSKALARIDILSSDVLFIDSNTIKIIPKNVLPYDTNVSVIIGSSVFKTYSNKSWPGNIGKWDSINFQTIKNPNAPTPIPTPGPTPAPTNPKPVNPNPKPGPPPPKDAPSIPETPEIRPPDDTVKPPSDGTITIPDPVKNEITLQSNDGLWTRNENFVDIKFKSIKQDVIISQVAANTSWVLQFNITDDAGVVKNIGRIGLERDAPKCTGEIDSPAVCFFTMYGAMKSLPEQAVDRYRQAPCENKVSDYGPGLSLRNKLIWRSGDAFEFRVSFSETQSQEFIVTYKCLSTERPASPGFSETIYETDTDKIYMWNGLEWFQLASSTLNVSQNLTFENPNTFMINGNWWYGMVWNKTLRRTYPLGKIFVPADYLNIDATRNYVRYYGPESGKTNVQERKSSARFITPVGFSNDGARGVYKSQ
jgi:hypothetical protein